MKVTLAEINKNRNLKFESEIRKKNYVLTHAVRKEWYSFLDLR